jgi:small redox-active disulfide protein 2
MHLRNNKIKTRNNYSNIKFFNQEVLIMDIKVLGPGCPKCQQTEKIVKDAVAEAGVDATVGHVTDTLEIAGYGVFGTPAVVIDGQVKSVGKIPKKEDVKSWLAE